MPESQGPSPVPHDLPTGVLHERSPLDGTHVLKLRTPDDRIIGTFQYPDWLRPYEHIFKEHLWRIYQDVAVLALAAALDRDDVGGDGMPSPPTGPQLMGP